MYSTLSHYGQNTWVRVGICIKQPDEAENLFSDNPCLKGVKRGAQRVFPNARLAICGICVKLEACGGLTVCGAMQLRGR